jgi:hypothetical protein
VVSKLFFYTWANLEGSKSNLGYTPNYNKMFQCFYFKKKRKKERKEKERKKGKF